jgi:hypothetical protein
MEFGEQRYRKLISQYTYTSRQSPLSHSFCAKVKEFPDLEAMGPWPAKAKENLETLILKTLREMDSRGEKIPGESGDVHIDDAENPTEYQAFLRSNQDSAASALMIASKYGFSESKHHKTWVIDQMIRALTGTQYEAFIEHACQRNNKDSGDWDEGNVP